MCPGGIEPRNFAIMGQGFRWVSLSVCREGGLYLVSRRREMRSDPFVNCVNVLIFVRLGVGVRRDVNGGDFVWGHGGELEQNNKASDFDLIYNRTRRVRHASTLEESHFFV